MAQKQPSTLDEALADVAFPTTKQHLLEEKGEVRVQVEAGREMTLREAVAPVMGNAFSTRTELLTKINEAHGLHWPRFHPHD